MSDSLKTLNNIRTLRAQARELSPEFIEEIVEKLIVIAGERREEQKQQKRPIASIRRKCKNFVRFLQNKVLTRMNCSMKAVLLNPVSKRQCVKLVHQNTNTLMNQVWKKRGQGREERQ